MDNSWKASDHPLQQAARGIVAHYEGEAWKGPAHIFDRRVDYISNIIAESPVMLKHATDLVDYLAEWTVVDLPNGHKALQALRDSIARATGQPTDAARATLADCDSASMEELVAAGDVLDKLHGERAGPNEETTKGGAE